jgi:hypothetical protein
MEAYAPATGKNISKSQKISRVRLDILCVHAKFHEKRTLLCLLKKTKMSGAKPFFSIENFVLFTHCTKNIIFS